MLKYSSVQYKNMITHYNSSSYTGTKISRINISVCWNSTT